MSAHTTPDNVRASHAVTADDVDAAADVAADVAAACDSIAPAWPLDRLIAVNPWWAWVGRPIAEAAAELSAQSGTRLVMSRDWLREQWRAGRVTETHVARALELQPSARTVADVMAALSEESPVLQRRKLVTDIVDDTRDVAHGMRWTEFVTRTLSQACAAYFDDGQSRWMPDRRGGLYPTWLAMARADAAPRLLMGMRGCREEVAGLPSTPGAMIALAIDALGVAPGDRAAYFGALLQTVNGWASVAAFHRWEARLRGGEDTQIEHLLAARLAWEVLLLRANAADDTVARWRHAQRAWKLAAPAARGSQEIDWIVQRALELAYQEPLARQLGTAGRAPGNSGAASPTTVQAVFCIDVRSEVFRRALEGVAPTVATRGFAGFFGLPIAFAPIAGPVRPQLPGLLAPTLCVTETGDGLDTIARRAVRTNVLGRAFKDGLATAASAFSAVEATGIAFAGALARKGFGRNAPSGDVLLAKATPGTAPLRMRLSSAVGDTAEPNAVRRADGANTLAAPDVAQRVALAAGILTAMGLTCDFAPIVALIGHGAGTENNPQACGLHCGACGGQTGEINARALASLLNEPAVRDGLIARGIPLTLATHVVAGLHNTTTDDVTLFDLDLVPATHRAAVAAWQDALHAAGTRARSERAAALGITRDEHQHVHDSVRARANDWSEVRPEWGLARNAAFIVGPRARTRGVNLEGRAFLHDYDCNADANFAVLEGILTAPMIVTHWINMQYWASTVDNARYGSGNKVLHNVVGGRVGVLEGAGGDVRIGLAMQSLHDGERWVHEPLRLSVFVEAPAAAIDDILARHPRVGALVANEWLFLHRIEPGGGRVFLRHADRWRLVAGEP